MGRGHPAPWRRASQSLLHDVAGPAGGAAVEENCEHPNQRPGCYCVHRQHLPPTAQMSRDWSRLQLSGVFLRGWGLAQEGGHGEMCLEGVAGPGPFLSLFPGHQKVNSSWPPVPHYRAKRKGAK